MSWPAMGGAGPGLAVTVAVTLGSNGGTRKYPVLIGGVGDASGSGSGCGRGSKTPLPSVRAGYGPVHSGMPLNSYIMDAQVRLGLSTAR